MGRFRIDTPIMDIVTVINQIAYLSESDDLNSLSELFRLVTVEKNTTLISSGKIERHLYFVKSGSCRIYYHKQEREVILDFCFPGDALISLNSYIHKQPGYETIQTLERCELYQISTESLHSLYSNSIAVANWGRKLAERETIKIESRLMSKLFKTASESYDELLQRAPKVVQKIKLGYIASYLGISQVTLSRIRAKA